MCGVREPEITELARARRRRSLSSHELDAGEDLPPAAHDAAADLLIVDVVLLVELEHCGHHLERRLGLGLGQGLGVGLG